MMEKSVVVTRFSNDESAHSPKQLKLESTTDVFIGQVHKFQISYFNPIQNGWVGAGGVREKKSPHTSFSPLTSTHVRVSSHFLTFSFNPFATLMKNFKVIPSVSPKLLNLNHNYPFKKVFFF